MTSFKDIVGLVVRLSGNDPKNRLSKSDFLGEMGGGDAQAVAARTASLAMAERDPDKVWAFVTLVGLFGLAQRNEDVLVRLIKERWHTFHDMIIFQLQGLSGGAVIDALEDIALNPPAGVDDAETQTTSNNATYAIAKIGGSYGLPALLRLADQAESVPTILLALELYGEVVSEGLSGHDSAVHLRSSYGQEGKHAVSNLIEWHELIDELELGYRGDLNDWHESLRIRDKSEGLINSEAARATSFGSIVRRVLASLDEIFILRTRQVEHMENLPWWRRRIPTAGSSRLSQEIAQRFDIQIQDTGQQGEIAGNPAS